MIPELDFLTAKLRSEKVLLSRLLQSHDTAVTILGTKPLYRLVLGYLVVLRTVFLPEEPFAEATPAAVRRKSPDAWTAKTSPNLS